MQEFLNTTLQIVGIFKLWFGLIPMLVQLFFSSIAPSADTNEVKSFLDDVNSLRTNCTFIQVEGIF